MSDEKTAFEARCDELAEQYKDDGGIAVVNHGPVQMAFKRPKQSDYERFLNKMQRDKGEAEAMRELVLCSCVEPTDHTAMRNMLRALPGVVSPVCKMLQQLAGSEINIELKAL
jgi:hypothetical protein